MGTSAPPYPGPPVGTLPFYPVAASGDDERSDDVADLRNQAKNAASESEREELEWAADRIELAARLDAQTFRELRRLYSDTVKELRRLTREGDVSVRAALIRGNETQLLGVLQAAGLDGYNANWQARLGEAETLAKQWRTLYDLPASTRTPDVEAFIAYDNSVRRARSLYPDTVVRPSLEVMQEGLRNAVTMERLPDAVSRIQERLEVTESQARTEASTRLAQFDRAVVQDQAERYDVNGYIYRGPLDGITRSFCRSCLSVSSDKWWPRNVVLMLNNGQTAVNPLYSGGGYNCRHFWLPLPESIIEERGLKRATVADAQAVNATAVRGKGKKK